jgi:hypothetical protein
MISAGTVGKQKTKFEKKKISKSEKSANTKTYHVQGL